MQVKRTPKTYDVCIIGSGAAMGQVVGPDVLLVISLGDKWRASLKQRDTQTALREHLGGGASRGAGADDAYVIRLGCAIDLHGSP